jgi:hypothetical protein
MPPKAFDKDDTETANAVPDPGASLAAAHQAAAAAPADDSETFVVKLAPRHAQYLRMRAQMNGRTPEEHLADILRVFRAHHDTARPDQRRAPVQHGEQAATFRA